MICSAWSGAGAGAWLGSAQFGSQLGTRRDLAEVWVDAQGSLSGYTRKKIFTKLTMRHSFPYSRAAVNDTEYRTADVTGPDFRPDGVLEFRQRQKTGLSPRSTEVNVFSTVKSDL